MKRGQLSREIILEQALKIASKSGLNKVTYNGLAREVGIQPQSMYRYLNNLADVRGGTLALYIEKLTTALSQLELPHSGKEALHQLSVDFIQFTQSGIPFSDMVSGIATYGQDSHVQDALAGLRSLFTPIIQSLTSDPQQAAANAELLIEFIIGHLGLMSVRRNTEQQQRQFEANIDRLLSLFN
ncbi:TetR/AcrR family transcriptional regulator [Secundilactobacillus folii]|uniref:TetR/AcrR family transcriptional regulator n=1 Tax=Secundilactobacillus folii TaxID=2678357 RepID=A0A7X2XTV9_9LACO|nr:TetR/AcrR family transcriptional regulator [Secundilactobacillus folii]MTV81474.1 TetR/AcrR family transcriptional regulator [Secundilactobacillus folii]